MKLVVNTSCAVAGGAVTHLKHILPWIAELSDDTIVLIADEEMYRRLGSHQGIDWYEIPPIAPGLLGRLTFENRVLPRILRDVEADVLFHPGNFGVLKPGCPQVTLVHNLAPFLESVIADESLTQKVRLGILRTLTRISLARSSATIFISAWGRSLVLENRSIDELRFPIVPFGSEHMAVESNSDILERLSLRPRQFNLTVSHIYRYKKLEKLIEAYELLGDRVSDLPLVVVGEHFDREYSGRLERDVKEKRLPVLFVGALGGADLAALMQESRIFLFSSEAENLPITLLEAMSAGCAVVTNRACSMPEVCRDAVLYAEPPRGTTYAGEMNSLLDDPDFENDLRHRARERARDFSWRSAAERTLEVLTRAGRND